MREKGFHLIHSNLDSRHQLHCSKILTKDINELAKKSRELNKKTHSVFSIQEHSHGKHLVKKDLLIIIKVLSII
jgi:hypothetical protein